ncbi:hypothetical protein G3I60_39730 [Streptomyces sp. SID13666]|uniref:NucA/NucB deoxyribonuclease domain-containing protein n=1 Tax=Streptomyces sp. SID13666 TaxID=2706054 RepID=UPI0013C08628|nr:NucA/NucB deoxyribonuclease domain-containing protein [Streptomyces sp. SID13666]NEA60132.1 hypothetical protein [Streptomyces sp. SID13666]
MLPLGAHLPTTWAPQPTHDTPPSLAALTQAEEQAAKQGHYGTAPAQNPAGARTSLQSDPYITVQGCRDLYGDQTGASPLDRFNYCAIRPSVIYTLNADGAIVGTTTFRFVTAGRGDKGSRSMYFTTGADRFVDVGTVSSPATTTLELTYSTSGYSDWDGTNPACTVTGNSPLKVLNWKQGSTSVFSISSAKTDGYSGDKISRCGIAQWGRSDLNVGWLQLERTNGRMDSSAYIGSLGGSIFLDVFPVFWDYSKSSPTHGAVAQHIWDAQYQPATTYPVKAGKSVPGSISSGKPLHRAVDVVWDVDSSTRVKANRTNRVAACTSLSPSGTPAGTQCDEYPFASTWEGAGVGDGNFSVRYLPSAQNGAAGTLLASWYTNQRILGREEYYIEIGA